jgi:leucyl-tRNA synthetase
MLSEPNRWNSIEDKWLDFWDKNHINISDPKPNKQKFFITVAYPYPNSPQHIGHGRTYTIADVHARYKKLKGYNVLFPMGFHYTGTPILGMSKRVQSGDKEIIENFRTIYQIEDKDIFTFVDPLRIAKYFHKEIKLGMKEMGYAIDWRREFTTIDPVYKKFVSWQFNTLKALGVIEQGSHPVGWCPKDGNPVSQHDTLGDVEPAFTEYLLIKFRLEQNSQDNVFLPVATLRPETIFGVTNIWINPEENYLVVQINGKENWVISKDAFNKLSYLNHNVKIIREVKGAEYVGLSVVAPMTKKAIPILPATFVTLDEGSGIVMSVPAHAPYDMQALLDLKKTLSIESVTKSRFKDITPISVIESKIYSQEFPLENANETVIPNKDLANDDVYPNTNLNSTQIPKYDSSSSINTNNDALKRDLSTNNTRAGFMERVPAMVYLNKYSISGQNDPNLEKATSELYSLEYYSGKMNDKAYSYANMTVPIAKDKVKHDLLIGNSAILFYELTNKPVYCRCGTQCYVKLLDNQWFLNYGNPKWKSLAFDCLNSMEIIPPEILKEFKNVFDWLKVRACARKSGLGTALPWDKEWLIESLSDSVIYMVYYIIAKFVNLSDLENYIDFIDNSFFDYVLLDKEPPDGSEHKKFLNKDNSKSLENKRGEQINSYTLNETSFKKFLEIAKEIKDEFEYYYPLDSRHSGRDLIPNHLSFFIFNHSIMFPKSKWPKQIAVNGSVLMDGKKMSKSMGNIIPLRSTIKKFNADSIRVAMLVLGELLQDVDFSFSTLRGIYGRLNDIYEFAVNFQSTYAKLINSILGNTLPASFDDSLAPDTLNATKDIASTSAHKYNTAFSFAKDLNLEDKWLLHKINATVLEVSQSFDEMRIRDALNTVLYLMDKDFEWYRKRRSSKNESQLNQENYVFVVYVFLKTRIKMMAPISPFLGEEIWNTVFSNQNSIQSIFNSGWPEYEKGFVNLVTEENEMLISNLLEDLNKILKVTKNTDIHRVYIYLAGTKKKNLYAKMIDIVINTKTKNFGVIMKSLLSDLSISEEQKNFIKSNPELVKKINEDILSLSPAELDRRGQTKEFDEKIPLEDAKSLIASELKIHSDCVEIFDETDLGITDPKNKSRLSRPYKPAIYVE